MISIIIPCYNVENYIEECLESAFAQRDVDIEVICIDNNSSDRTWERLEHKKIKFPSLILGKELKPGAPAARNKGLSMAKGDWIQFLDADDLLLPGKIQHQVKLIEKNKEAVFIAGACVHQYLSGEKKKIIPDSNDIFKSLFFTQLGNTCSNLWNSKFLLQIGGWNESLKSSQEADLMFRLLQIYTNVIFDHKPFTVIRERVSGQISQTNLSEKWQRFFFKRNEMVQWLKFYKKEYYLEQGQVYEDGLFGILKILASEDRKVAVELHKKFLGNKFRPGAKQMHSTHSYLILLRLLGFKRAEQVRKLLG